MGMDSFAEAPLASACKIPLEPAAVESGQRFDSMPLTPPHSAHRTSWGRKHQQYLDSLEPPSPTTFARLCRLQEEREEEHRKRYHDLRRQTDALRRQSMEARRDFMHAKTLDDEAQERQSAKQRRSMLGRRSLSPGSRSRPRTCGSDTQRSMNRPESEHEEADSDGESLRGKAATVIQRTYRGHRVRREMQGLGIDASTRWTHAIRDARWNELNRPRPRSDSGPQNEPRSTDRPSTSRSQARQNWMKVATIARRAGADEDSDHFDQERSSGPDSDEWANMSPEQRDAAQKRREEAQAKRREHARTMGLQYFLEMIDLSHRYGSNLRKYHEEWKRANTNENFFYWLDYGEGKTVEAATCPRERLDREKVRYLSREERQHYLVKVDQEGRLIWAKNGIRLDTTEEWKDSIYGIVPADDSTPAFSPEVERHAQHRDSSSNSSISSGHEAELEAARAAKYANTDLDNAKGVRKIGHISAATIFNKLLRKSVKKNTWIFVADTAFRLYVGIKASGAFQHSSFLRGSRISAAGLIKVKNGRLSRLSPLSGHYRPPASNFRAFVHSLRDEGVDMSHVSISRSYVVLEGLEVYMKARRKGKETLRRMSLKKTKVLQPKEAKRIEEEAWDHSQSAAKERKVLEKEGKQHDENKASVKLLQKMHIRPRTPMIHSNDGAEKDEGVEGV